MHDDEEEIKYKKKDKKNICIRAKVFDFDFDLIAPWSYENLALLHLLVYYVFCGIPTTDYRYRYRPRNWIIHIYIMEKK